MYAGIVTTTHKLLKDIQLATDTIGVLARDNHTTHITTAIEGTDITRVRQVGGRIVIIRIIKDKAWQERHGGTIHIGRHIC